MARSTTSARILTRSRVRKMGGQLEVEKRGLFFPIKWPTCAHCGIDFYSQKLKDAHRCPALKRPKQPKPKLRTKTLAPPQPRKLKTRRRSTRTENSWQTRLNRCLPLAEDNDVPRKAYNVRTRLRVKMLGEPAPPIPRDYLRCYFCPEGFYTESALVKHRSRVHQMPRQRFSQKSNFCSVCCKNVDDIREHLTTEHVPLQFRRHRCDRCGGKWVLLEQLKRHQKEPCDLK